MTNRPDDCYKCWVETQMQPAELALHLTCEECEDYTRGWEWHKGEKRSICFHCFMLQELFKVQEDLAEGRLKATEKPRAVDETKKSELE